MIKNILFVLLSLCISFNIHAKPNKKENTPIEVTNIFTCYDLNLLTLTDGNTILCQKDLNNKKKVKYDRDLAIEQINLCTSTDRIAILTLIGQVFCITKD